jgi:hypothetical protein
MPDISKALTEGATNTSRTMSPASIVSVRDRFIFFTSIPAGSVILVGPAGLVVIVVGKDE